jgi:hypothetical protein
MTPRKAPRHSRPYRDASGDDTASLAITMAAITGHRTIPLIQARTEAVTIAVYRVREAAVMEGRKPLAQLAGEIS